MALPGVVVKIGGEAKKALTSIDQVGDALSDLPGKAASAAQGVGRHASDLASHVRRSGDETEEAGNKTKRSFEGMEDSGIGAATAIGEAFGSGGGPASALGSLGEVVESFAGMFGPMGLAISAGAGVALGALSGLFGKSAEDAAKAEQAAHDWADALIEGMGHVDEETKKSLWRDFVRERAKDLAVFKRLAGSEGMGLLTAAIQGNGAAANQVVPQIEAMMRAQYELKNSGQQTQAQTLANVQALNAVKGSVQNTAAAFRAGTDELSLYEDGLGNVKKELDKVDGAKARVRLDLQVAVDESDFENFAKEYGLSDAQRRRLAQHAAYYANAPTRQAGGQVRAGEPYWVGESGPEMFTPTSSGYVTPTAQATAGGPITVHMHLHAAVATPSVIREAAPVVTRAIVDAQRRSGTRTPAHVYTNMGR